MYEQELMKLGLTHGEARAYAALLELGSTTVGRLVKKSGISYSKIYEVLQRLIEKGLASYVLKEKTKHFQAVEPRRLQDVLERRKIELDKQQKALSSLLPQLEKQAIVPRQEAEIFVGLRGLQTAYEQLLLDSKKGDVLNFFYVYDEKYHALAEDFYATIFPFFGKKGVLLQGIMQGRKHVLRKTPSFVQLRFVQFPVPGIIDIFKDKVLISTWREKPIAFLLHSRELAGNLQNYFQTIWNT